jgi:hypothetical protein
MPPIIYKQCTSELVVVRRVTTAESPLLYGFAFLVDSSRVNEARAGESPR